MFFLDRKIIFVKCLGGGTMEHVFTLLLAENALGFCVSGTFVFYEDCSLFEEVVHEGEWVVAVSEKEVTFCGGDM
jgi:hypothetical protein